MSELTRRIIFAVIAAPASIAIVYFGDWALAILLSVLAALAAWELFRIARETGSYPIEPAGIGLAALVPIAIHAQRLGLYTLSLTVIVAIALLLFASAIPATSRGNAPVSRAILNSSHAASAARTESRIASAQSPK